MAGDMCAVCATDSQTPHVIRQRKAWIYLHSTLNLFTHFSFVEMRINCTLVTEKNDNPSSSAE